MQSLTMALTVSVLGLAACVGREHTAHVEARRAYEACLAEHAGAATACEVERAEADRRYDEYDTRAREQWGCDRDPNRCDPARSRD